MRSWETLVNNVDLTLTAFWGCLPKVVMGGLTVHTWLGAGS